MNKYIDLKSVNFTKKSFDVLDNEKLSIVNLQ